MNSRPGIVVSCDPLNRTAGCVTVVMCSKSNHKDMPCHVTIRSMSEQSTAMCQHTYTVDKTRLGRYLGKISNLALQQVEVALMSALGMDDIAPCKPAGGTGLGVDEQSPSEEQMFPYTLLVAETEKNVYKSIYEQLIGKLVGKAGA